MALDTQLSELSLLDWRRRIFALYAEIRDAEPEGGWRRWRAERDLLFSEHPQSPLAADDRAAFDGVPYFAYEPSFRVQAEVIPVAEETIELSTSTGEPIRFRRFADAAFALHDASCTLPLYWLEGYGGGVFLPFADATSGRATYGGGRYLLDTVKGADLGMAGERLVLDFNFAYNPSCAYADHWTCPLPPRASRLELPVEAGERVTRIP
ncbi:MAG TPA: DUF1684 domain-containing protein [Gaiellales bacterium]|nr:DUF1684 domain-containing protein [Gaiellales bacterium]